MSLLTYMIETKKKGKQSRHFAIPNGIVGRGSGQNDSHSGVQPCKTQLRRGNMGPRICCIGIVELSGIKKRPLLSMTICPADTVDR